ncbi:ABC transporter permease [Shimia thalassica]|jgi:putative spermidine/putrescine transport system permease protein|uniref:ABC transporter permease n=1 Tax=Shimia thalassica TaxID=1715693 RepID=UPI001C098DF9|nr:ABC transporter permease [Shimia thalassica]MBU2942904.1 ABC transporter permease [Shimia thalassica]MDO6479235.1 ABC transporter permease [Shimia thalassica]MDO6502774.1 ABC transporter permease [Shimia thalassica]MDP2492608.1 ABC transporter permease [Shimia thalassica]MDP2581042.1 ABC transporter permease [Shimia thalassica]
MKRSLVPYLIGLFPLAMMVVFFLAPLAFMIVVSFYERDPLGFYKVSFVWDNYAKFFSSFYYTISMRSLWSASLGALVVVLLAFPAMYIIVDMHRRWQLFWVILLLSLMCLSEVIIGFAWLILFSESSGIPKFLGWMGLWDNPRSLSPSFGAMLIGFITLGFSLVALMFYPQMAQRDRSIEEAALTLGTPPARVFSKVVLPNFMPAIVSSVVTMFVYFLGVFVMPTMLGRPQDWNMTVIITDKAVGDANMPLGAALSVIMLLFTLLIIGGLMLASRKREASS